MRRTEAAFRGHPQGERVAFATIDLLWQVLTKERWELLQAMTGQHPMLPQTLAERVGKAAGAVQEAVEALRLAGILEQDDAGRVSFPYDAIHVDFTLTRAA